MGLIHMLRKRYPAQQYALFEELRNGTGWSRGPRSADAVAFSLWPSRGLELLGFECKVSRSDWKRELDQPSKAEAIQQFCDRWWVVVSDPAFVHDGELPPTWGLLAATKGFEKTSKLRVVKDAPKLEAKPLDRLMLASMFRNLADSEAGRFRARAAELVSAEKENRPKPAHVLELEHIRSTHERLVVAVREFETASGLNVMQGFHGGAQVGALMQLLGGTWQVDSLDWLRKQASTAERTYIDAAESAGRVRELIDRVVTGKKSEAA